MELSSFEKAFNSVIDNANKNVKSSDSDYFGADGLLYCGVCNEPKQHRLNINGEIITVPCICKCRQEEIKKEEEEDRKRKRLEIVEKLKENSLIEERFRNCKFSDFMTNADNLRNLTIAKRYVEKFDDLFKKDQGLLLYGGYGNGKSMLACCIANELMERFVPVYITSVIKVLEAEKSLNSGNSDKPYMNYIRNSDLLILDDLGAERGTDYALEILYNVIDSRYRSGKPLIVTTNLTLQEMQNASDSRYGRIYDRIFEMCYPVEFKGISMRKKRAAKQFDEMSKLFE